MTWIKEQIEIILMALGTVGVAWRNEHKTNQVYKAVFDERGSIRFPTFRICDQCRTQCQQELRDDIKELHSEVTIIQKDIKSILIKMPSQ